MQFLAFPGALEDTAQCRKNFLQAVHVGSRAPKFDLPAPSSLHISHLKSDKELSSTITIAMRSILIDYLNRRTSIQGES